MSEIVLIEKSIVINGIGRPDLKTVFTIADEKEKKDPLYFALEKIIGRTLNVNFKYFENAVEKSGFSLFKIPLNFKSELEVKDFILTELNKKIKP